MPRTRISNTSTKGAPLIETDQVSLRSGNPEPVTVPTASGRLQEIYRCPLLPGSRLERLGAVAEMVPDTTENVIDGAASKRCSR